MKEGYSYEQSKISASVHFTIDHNILIWVQIVARPWRDDVALAAAHVIERALGGWQPPKLN